MTAPGGFGFPGASMPGAAPVAPAMAPQAGFILDIPPDPTWEPFDTADVLDKDGFYQCKISKESGRNDANKSQGVFLTLEVQDEDARGKILSRFLPDPRTAKGNVWFIWRGLLRSITGSVDGARQGLRYQPGMFVGQLVYVKTERGFRDDRVSTDIDSWVTGQEWADAVKSGRHRWAPRAQPAGGAGGVGALPGGMPAGFPGMPAPGGMTGLPVGGGLPGAPGPATQPTTPQPTGAPFGSAPPAPVVQQQQTAPPAQGPFAPNTGAPMTAPAPSFPTVPAPEAQAVPPAAAPTAPAPAAPGQPFSFANFPGMAAPPPVAGGANGAAPPATAATIASSFPGMPPRQ